MVGVNLFVFTVIGIFLVSFVIAFIYEVIKIAYVFTLNNPNYSESDLEELKNNISKNGKHFYGVIFRNSLIIMLCFYLINIILGM